MEGILPNIGKEQLLLREATMHDLDEFALLVFADPDVVRYMPKRDMTHRERAQRAFKVPNQNWLDHDYGSCVIADKVDSQLIVECDSDTRETFDIELGYSLAEPYWGKGIAPEAAQIAVRFGFREAKLGRIIAVVVQKMPHMVPISTSF